MNNKAKEYMIGSLTLSFKEYLYGYKRLVTVVNNPKSSKTKVLFYYTSMYKYIADYFAIADALVFKTLAEVGLSNLGKPIKLLISKPLGKITYGEFLRRFRNKSLVHKGYASMSSHMVHVEGGQYELLGPYLLAHYNNQMFHEIEKLHKELMKLLPKNKGY